MTLKSTVELKSPLIDLLHIFILLFCIMSQRNCFSKTRHCDVIVGLFCDVTPHNQGFSIRQTIATCTARAKWYPTCEISILFTVIFTGYHVSKDIDPHRTLCIHHLSNFQTHLKPIMQHKLDINLYMYKHMLFSVHGADQRILEVNVSTPLQIMNTEWGIIGQLYGE